MNDPDQLRQLLRQMVFARSLAPEHLASGKAWHLGGAGVSLAILLLVVQVPDRSLALQMAVWGAAVSLPLWVALAGGIATRLQLAAIRLPADTSAMKAGAVLHLVTVAAFIFSIGCVIFHLSLVGFILFITAATVGLLQWVLVLKLAEHVAAKEELANLQGRAR